MNTKYLKNINKNVASVSAEELHVFKTWFHEYTSHFISPKNKKEDPYETKIKHTKDVCNEIIEITKTFDLHKKKLCIAEVIALFHDIGRFEQYQTYETFYDEASVDHGELGVDILRKHNIMKQLDTLTKRTIYTAIKQHNKLSISIPYNPFIYFFCCLIRDADKLVLFPFIVKNYKHDEIYFKDNTLLSEKLYDMIIHGIPIKRNMVRSINEFRLLHLSWINDIHFQQSLKRIKEKNIISIIIDQLPDNNKKKVLEEYFSKK